MPGVPSGRGCEACINLKKKCDQLKPACSRCARLRIPCIGNGKQRYKFKVVIGGSQMEARSKHSQSRVLAVTRLERSPSNETTSMLNDFIHKLDVKDLRYDICWTYGDLFREIPKRLGTNAALDASVRAITTVFSSLTLAQKPLEAFVRYGNALRALKECLEDPVAVLSSSTLCAIYLIWICQSWIALDEEIASGHGAGIVRLLATAPYRHSQDNFDRLVLVTIAAPVLFEGIFDPTVKLNPWLKKVMLETEKPIFEDEVTNFDTTERGQPQAGRFLNCVARLPEFLQYNPALHSEIVLSYRSIHKTSMKLHEKLTDVKAFMMKEAAVTGEVKFYGVSMTPNKLHNLYHKMFAMFLSLEILLNGILRKYDPEDEVLRQESLHLSEQIIDISLEALVWKPLGAGWTAVCLISAWAATFDADRRAGIEKAYIECCMDHTKRSLESCGTQMERLFEKLGFEVSNATIPTLEAAENESHLPLRAT